MVALQLNINKIKLVNSLSIHTHERAPKTRNNYYYFHHWGTISHSAVAQKNVKLVVARIIDNATKSMLLSLSRWPFLLLLLSD